MCVFDEINTIFQCKVADLWKSSTSNINSEHRCNSSFDPWYLSIRAKLRVRRFFFHSCLLTSLFLHCKPFILLFEIIVWVAVYIEAVYRLSPSFDTSLVPHTLHISPMRNCHRAWDGSGFVCHWGIHEDPSKHEELAKAFSLLHICYPVKCLGLD